jgi:hypothetical protein
MTQQPVTFEVFLDGLFFPVDGKQKKKKKQKNEEVGGYRRKDASGDNILAFAETGARYWYAGKEYPEIIIAGAYDEGAITPGIDSLLSAGTDHVDLTLDKKAKGLLAFRADDYALFSAVNVPVPAPNLLVRKGSLARLEERINSPDKAVAPPSAEKIEIVHPAEFIVSRFFLPPRATFPPFAFASVPLRVTREYSVPQNTRHVCLAASWTFSGKPLSVRYHLEFAPSDGAQTEKIAKAAVSAFFREALQFWNAWKQPIEKPALSEISGPNAMPATSSTFLAAELRGETMRIPCTVELPPYFPDLICRLTQTALSDPTDHARVFDIVRANDNLFIMMKPMYRKAFLAAPKGAVPFAGPTIHGLLSLMNETDRSIVIQNFLLSRNDLKALPFFFYYHEARQQTETETVYRLKPAVPLAFGEIEMYLSDSIKQEWSTNLRSGCMYRICLLEETVKLNAEAVVNLALDGAAGKFLLSEKAMNILREEILEPIDATYLKEIEGINERKDIIERLGGAAPKVLMETLAKLENKNLAMACFGFTGLLVQLDRGISSSRQKDIRSEIDVVTVRRKKGEITAHQLLDAKNHFIELVGKMPLANEELVL